MTVRVAIHGAAGRMGLAIAKVVLADEDCRLMAALEHTEHSELGMDVGLLATGKPAKLDVTDDLAALTRVDVVIDFSNPAGTAALARRCAEQGLATVVGTTGLDAEADAALNDLAKKAPVVVAPNMSVGVTALFHLAAEAARLLGPAYDAEIVEMHHRRKVDAPSGTAVRLARGVAEAKGLDPEKHVVHGRSGQVGARPDQEIGVMTLRGGDVVGEHTLVLAGPGERVELTHRAQSRDIFAQGSVRAAKWVVGRDAGRYDMADVLGIAR